MMIIFSALLLIASLAMDGYVPPLNLVWGMKPGDAGRALEGEDYSIGKLSPGRPKLNVDYYDSGAAREIALSCPDQGRRNIGP